MSMKCHHLNSWKECGSGQKDTLTTLSKREDNHNYHQRKPVGKERRIGWRTTLIKYMGERKPSNRPIKNISL